MLKIDPEFKSLIPPLSPEEYSGLERNIIANGCLDSIKVWNDLIVDGHNRFDICSKHGVDYRVEPMVFSNRSDVVVWMIRNQFDRRNLTPYQRAELALKLEPVLREKARENQVKGGELKDKLLLNSAKATDDCVDTTAELAKQAGIGRDNMRKAKKIAAAATEEQKEQLRAGETSINRVYVEIRDSETFSNELVSVSSGPVANESLPTIPQNQKLKPLFSSLTPEHYTPKDIIDRVVKVLGVIDLDPCSNSKTEPNVPAQGHYTKDDNGLSKEWVGKVYMNPPYGRDISNWVDKLLSEYETGHVMEAIVLVPSRTDTNWFFNLTSVATITCTIKGRLQFINDNNNSAPFPSMVFFIGKSSSRFSKIFKELGRIWKLE